MPSLAEHLSSGPERPHTCQPFRTRFRAIGSDIVDVWGSMRPVDGLRYILGPPPPMGPGGGSGLSLPSGDRGFGADIGPDLGG